MEERVRGKGCRLIRYRNYRVNSEEAWLENLSLDNGIGGELSPMATLTMGLMSRYVVDGMTMFEYRAYRQEPVNEYAQNYEKFGGAASLHRRDIVTRSWWKRKQD